MARRVRHDLIKHLDVPQKGVSLGIDEIHVLLRRLFDSGTGVCRMAAVWGFKLRRDEQWRPEFEAPMAALEKDCAELSKYESNLRKLASSGGIPDATIIEKIRKIVEDVHEFESICMKLDESGNEDEMAAMSFFNFAPVPTPEPPVQPKESGSTADQLRILVVDDHLMSIDRLQAHPTFCSRFSWLTLCDEACECQHCPKRENCGMRRARTGMETIQALEKARKKDLRVDALLMDVRFDDLKTEELLWIPEMPALNHEENVKALQGLIIARQIRRMPQFRHIPIVLMTARSHLPQGAAGLLEGLEGLQFVDDDDSLETLASRLESVVKMGREAPVEQGYFWGTSPKIQQIRRLVEIMSIGPRTVFINGPSGSGKSALVEHIIYPLSQRKRLVTLDLSAVPDTLVESELFGHVKGAYSGATHDRVGLIEEADGGILFLDEIGNLSLENQRKLLLFLQDKMVRRVGAAHETRKHVDVKVVVATHLDLSEEVAAGRFRFDLYMRFGPAMRIVLPSLTDRRDDLDAFVEMLALKIVHSEDMAPHFAEHIKRTGANGQIQIDFASGKPVQAGDICVRFKEATRELFLNYAWPGNTRELESVLDTLILKALYELRVSESKSRVIEIDHYYALSLLGGIVRQSNDNATPQSSSQMQESSVFSEIGKMNDFAELRQTLEKRCLCNAFDICQGNIDRMGMMLFGDDSPTMQHKITVRMNQLGLSVRRLKNMIP